MDAILKQLLEHFDFALMVVINVTTYAAIKALDEVNGDKVPTVWQKRLLFLMSAIIIGTVYWLTSDIDVNVIINSCIVAPVAWSWLAKPLCSKLGIDYKQETKK